jgi:hypothetical protein
VLQIFIKNIYDSHKPYIILEHKALMKYQTRRDFLQSTGAILAAPILMPFKKTNSITPYFSLNIFSPIYIHDQDQISAERMGAIDNRLIIYASRTKWKDLDVLINKKPTGCLDSPEDYIITEEKLNRHEKVLDVDFLEKFSKRNIKDVSIRIPSRQELLTFAIESDAKNGYKTKRFNPMLNRKPLRGLTSFEYQGIQYNLYDLIDFVI